MASIALNPGQVFDPLEFADYVSENLPGFAQPVFVRIQTDLTTTGTFKLVKGDLRKQSFHIEQVGNDTSYVMMPRTNSYQILDQALYGSIMDGSAGY